MINLFMIIILMLLLAKLIIDPYCNLKLKILLQFSILIILNNSMMNYIKVYYFKVFLMKYLFFNIANLMD